MATLLPTDARAAVTGGTIFPDNFANSRAGGYDQVSAPVADLPKKEKKNGGLFADIGNENRLAANLPTYKKLRVLGQGAFGKAYLVEKLQGSGNQQTPAVESAASAAPDIRVLKKMQLSGRSAEDREAVFREAMLMRRISRGCPYIAQFSEVFLGKAGSQLCLVLEFCSGGDLHERLQKQEGTHLPEQQILDWAAQVSLALQYCHSNSIMHRDVKPMNCFFRTAGGTLVLGDFGISCALDERTNAPKTCVGTPHYLSPEVIEATPYTYTADAWSLGVVLYEMIMLKHPFTGLNICQIAFRIIAGVAAPINAELYSQELQQLVDRLLEKDPSKRASVDDVLATSCLNGAAVSACEKTGYAWPSATSLVTGTSASSGKVAGGGGAGSGRTGGLVNRLRGRVSEPQLAASPDDQQGVVEYEDDFEDADLSPCDHNDAYDGDDFEPFSGSEASYEQDFEDDSGSEGAGRRPTSPKKAVPEPIDEVEVRRRMLAALGEDGLCVVQSLGAMPFLEEMMACGAR